MYFQAATLDISVLNVLWVKGATKIGMANIAQMDLEWTDAGKSISVEDEKAERR